MKDCFCPNGRTGVKCNELISVEYPNTILSNRPVLIAILTSSTLVIVVVVVYVVRICHEEESRVAQRSVRRKLTFVATTKEPNESKSQISKFPLLTQAVVRGIQMPLSILYVRSKRTSAVGKFIYFLFLKNVYKFFSKF